MPENCTLDSRPLQLIADMSVQGNNLMYSTVTKTRHPRTTMHVKTPSKEDAIIFPVIDNTTNEQYALALTESLKPDSIYFVSRMSNCRICIYLDSKITVNFFMQDKRYIILNDTRINARRLVNPTKKLILSNAPPIIPHEFLEKELKQITDLQLCSPVIYVNAGFVADSTKHVLSFRRSVYYSIQDSTITISDSMI